MCQEISKLAGVHGGKDYNPGCGRVLRSSADARMSDEVGHLNSSRLHVRTIKALGGRRLSASEEVGSFVLVAHKAAAQSPALRKYEVADGQETGFLEGGG